MSALAGVLAAWIAGVNPWEALAVVLGAAYLLLAMRENIWCWHAAFASTLIYIFLFRDVGLLMESALQVYYLAMAVYGWWLWRRGARHAGESLPIRTRPARWHLLAVLGVVAAAGISALLLVRYSSASRPFVDSLVTWGSILATWMVAQKLLENWLYWIVIDSISLWLYLDRGLYLTAGLFMAYLVIVVFGYLQWRRHYREQDPALAAQGARRAVP